MKITILVLCLAAIAAPGGNGPTNAESGSPSAWTMRGAPARHHSGIAPDTTSRHVELGTGRNAKRDHLSRLVWMAMRAGFSAPRTRWRIRMPRRMEKRRRIA